MWQRKRRPVRRTTNQPKLNSRHWSLPRLDWFLVSLTLIAWAVWGFMVLLVEPELVKDFPITNTYGPFFISLLVALLFSLKLVTRSWRRSLIWSIVSVVSLQLKLYQLNNIINFLLLLVLGLVLDRVALTKPTSQTVIKSSSQDEQ